MDPLDALAPSIDEALRRDVRLLGKLLGKTIRDQRGESLFQLVEEVRRMAKEARKIEAEQSPKLIEKLSNLDDTELLYLARAFTLFLNLANIAEQHHQVRQRRRTAFQAAEDYAGLTRDPESDPLDAGPHPSHDYFENELARLRDRGVDSQVLHEHICKLRIDLVLTAHPTEVLRRSVSSKYLRIARLLAQRDLPDLSLGERREIVLALHRTITEVWETDEIRRVSPTPVDEARTGLVCVEQILWDAVPKISRELDQSMQVVLGKRLPLEARPVTFGSWMGGDRDGNSNTTPEVTRTVCSMSRLRAAELFWEDIDDLRRELSMTRCDGALRAEVGRESMSPTADCCEGFRNGFGPPSGFMPESLRMRTPGGTIRAS